LAFEILVIARFEILDHCICTKSTPVNKLLLNTPEGSKKPNPQIGLSVTTYDKSKQQKVFSEYVEVGQERLETPEKKYNDNLPEGTCF